MSTNDPVSNSTDPDARGATLDEVDISQPAAGGLLRRGLRRLVVSTVAVDADDPADER